MKTFLMLICVLWSTTAFAQVESIVSRDVGFFLAGVDPAAGGQPFQAPTNYPLSGTTCGQAKVSVIGTVTNPTDIRIDDPADNSKDCILTPSVAVLAAIPFGTGYRAASRSNGATKQSAWSTLSNPFDRASLPPPTPTGVRVR